MPAPTFSSTSATPSTMYPPALGGAVKGALPVTNSIKTSIATVAGPASYSGAGLNGAIGAAAMELPRTVSVTTSAHAASYVAGSTITFTGTDKDGNVLIEALALVATGGGETIVGVKGFMQITQIDVQAQADTLGTFTFGTQDIVVPGSRYVIIGTTGDLHVTYANGSQSTIPKIPVGQYAMSVSKIWGDSKTTAQDITVQA